MLLDQAREFLDVLLHLGIAYLVALPVGWERDHAARRFGLRTFPLVSMGACAYALISIGAFSDSPESQARVLQGLLTGMGFIGGGAILKRERKQTVRGLATAASIWNTGAIGAAVAFDRFYLAIVLSLANLATLHLLDRFRHSLEGSIRATEDDATEKS